MLYVCNVCMSVVFVGAGELDGVRRERLWSARVRVILRASTDMQHTRYIMTHNPLQTVSVCQHFETKLRNLLKFALYFKN